MAPYAEAGNRSLLFGTDVKVMSTGRRTIVQVNSSVFPDMLTLNDREESMTIESDAMGIVYKDGEPTTGPVHIPTSAIFETIDGS
jgi:hypothetical protein